MGQHCYICNSSGKLGRCLASQLFALLRLIQLSLRNDSIVFGLKHINKMASAHSPTQGLCSYALFEPN